MNFTTSAKPERAEAAAARRTLSDSLRSPAENNFDIVRLLAALAVVFGHSFVLSLHSSLAAEPVKMLAGFVYSGSAAVAVFFLVSGIFVSQSFYYENNPFAFLVKRLFRIWPGLVVCVIVAAIAVTIACRGLGTDLSRDKSFFQYIVSSSLLDTTWRIDGVFSDRPRYAINGSLWTLPLEVKMYAVVFLFGVFGVLRRRAYLLALLALGIGVLVAAPSVFSGYFATGNPEAVRPVLFFLIGMAIFAARDEVALGSVFRPVLLFLIAAAFPRTREFFGDLFMIAATLWIGCSPLLARLPKLPGDYSYGVYIYGFPIQQLVVTFNPAIGPYALFAVAGSVTLLCAIASWYLVEKPAQKAAKRIARVLANLEGEAPQRNLMALGGVLRASRRGWAVPVSAFAMAGAGLAWAANASSHLPITPLPMQIVAFGPTPIKAAQPFNVQPDGRSAIWVSTDRLANPGDVLVLGGHRLVTQISGALLTATVPPSAIATKGTLPLVVERDSATSRAQSPAAAFVVN